MSYSINLKLTCPHHPRWKPGQPIQKIPRKTYSFRYEQDIEEMATCDTCSKIKYFCEAVDRTVREVNYETKTVRKERELKRVVKNETPIQYYKRTGCTPDWFMKKCNGKYYCNPAHCKGVWTNKKERDKHVEMAYAALG